MVRSFLIACTSRLFTTARLATPSWGPWRTFSWELKRAQCREAACDYWAKVHYPGASAGVCEGKLPRRTHCTNLGFWRCIKGTQGVRMGFCDGLLDLCIPFASATGIWRGWSDRFPFRTKLEAHRRWFLSICNTWICPWPWRVLPCYHAVRPYMAHVRSDFVGPDWLIGCLLLGCLVGWWVGWLIDLCMMFGSFSSCCAVGKSAMAHSSRLVSPVGGIFFQKLPRWLSQLHCCNASGSGSCGTCGPCWACAEFRRAL